MDHRRLVSIAVFSLAAAGSWAFGGPELLVASRSTDSVLRYDAHTGSFLGVLARGGLIENPNDLERGPDGFVYLSNGNAGEVLRIDPVTGAASVFTHGGPTRYTATRGIAFGPDGDLYVNSDSDLSNEVFRFDGRTGEYLGVAASGHGLDAPIGIDFDQQGTMFIGAQLSNDVHVYENGEYARTLGSGPRIGAAGVLALNDGTLLVAYTRTNLVTQIDAQTGAVIRNVMRIVDGASIPIELERTPWNTLLVSSYGTHSVFEYDLTTFAFLGELVTPGAGGLANPQGILVIPSPAGAMVLVAAALRPRRRR